MKQIDHNKLIFQKWLHLLRANKYVSYYSAPFEQKTPKEKERFALTHKPTTGYLIWKFWFFNSFKKKILWSFFYSFFVFLILIAFKPEKSGWRNIAYFHIKYPVSPENITTTQKSHHQKKKKEKKFNHLS